MSNGEIAWRLVIGGDDKLDKMPQWLEEILLNRAVEDVEDKMERRRIKNRLRAS